MNTKLIIICAMMVTTVAANAADTRWIGNGEDWSDTDWWVGGVEPTASHSCQIDGEVVVSKAGEVVGRGFYVGYGLSHDATVRIVSGDLTTGDTVQISFFGYGGKGTLEIFDGVFRPTALCILGNSSAGNGQWFVDGGYIDAEAIRIGDAGTGTIIQTAGIVECDGITMGDNDGSSGMYEISGGALTSSWLKFGPNRFRTAAPTLKILSHFADITLEGALSLFSKNSVINAVRGSKIKMVGQYANFVNELNTISEPNVADMKNLTLEFSDNSTSTYCTYEVACEDVGANVAGYCGDNFTLHTLAVGGDTPGKVCLVDTFNNGNRAGGSECLYVRKLIVTAGSTLHLGGLNLYYLEAEIDGTIIGTPQEIYMLDMNSDGVIAYYELMTIAEYWLSETCTCPDLCGGADLDIDGSVNFCDFAIFARNWLDCNLDPPSECWE